eukprot:TRINITY_DN1343_c0_g2_i4.p1 TRINITY_DN1343_c0_g2~~TRINITY_DN1343_c0_g2_i4.p1  ORF type:complete len:629 (+),score=139.39 TRINITY_DN1343_c0_g2_i4:1327-3213(+)
MAMKSPVKDAINRINSGKTHYEVLGVSSTCTADDIKKSYRSLCLLVHPDKSGEKTDHVFNLVRVAYETLKEPASRQSYDIKLRTDAQIRNATATWPMWSNFSVSRPAPRPAPPPAKPKPAPTSRKAQSQANPAFAAASDWPSGVKPNTFLDSRNGILRQVNCSHCKRDIFMEHDVYTRFSATEELAKCCSCNKEFAQVSCAFCKAEYIVNYIKGWIGSVPCASDFCKKEFPLNYPPPPHTPAWTHIILTKTRTAPPPTTNTHPTNTTSHTHAHTNGKSEEQIRRENDARLQQEAVERSRREADILRAQKKAQMEGEELRKKLFEAAQKFSSSTNINSTTSNTTNTSTFSFTTPTPSATTSQSVPFTTSTTNTTPTSSTHTTSNNNNTHTNGTTNAFPTASTTASTSTTTTASKTNGVPTSTTTTTTTTSTSSKRANTSTTTKRQTKKAATAGITSGFFSTSFSGKAVASSSNNFAKKKRKGSDTEDSDSEDSESEEEKPKDKKKRKVENAKKKGKVRKGRNEDSDDNSNNKKKKKLNPRKSGSKRKKRNDSSDDDSDSESSSSSMSDVEAEEYEVENILNKRLFQGQVQYYVKWANYGESDCTWEPEYNLTHCPDIIEEFERRARTGL